MNGTIKTLATFVFQTMSIASLGFAMDSCGGGNLRESEDVIQRLVGHEMAMPPNDAFCCVDSGNVNVDLTGSEYKILCFVDSGGCTTCNMKLRKWEKLIGMLHRATDADIAFTMVVLHKGKDEIAEILAQEGFRYPVYLDGDGSYTLSAGASVEKTLNTVLLDADNKVLAVGNPVLNPHVSELFVEMMGGDSAVTSLTSAALEIAPVKCEPSYIMVGAIRHGVSVQVHVSLTNMSDSVLHVSDVIASCECTDVKFSKDSIIPGMSLRPTIMLTNDSVSPLESRFNRTVDFYFKGFEHPVTVTIAGYGVTCDD